MPTDAGRGAPSSARPQDLFPAETTSPAETRTLGRRLARRLTSPWVLALYGEMGVGKTHFVKGLADGLGLDGDAVTSPTFTIVHELRRGTAALNHVDAYRIEHPRDLTGFDVEDLLYGSVSTVIEWPDRLEALLGPETIRLRFSHAGDHRRLIEWGAGPA
jgi:tRNA threonylcarbamoyladenosine biosynthesis protein TsaE